MASLVASDFRLFLVGVSILASSVSCIYLTGVADYEKGACEGPCADGGSDAPSDTSGPCPAGMIAVAGGTYTPSAKPSGGLVTIGALCVDPTEVSESSYRTCVGTGKCTAPASKTFCNYGLSGRGNDPVNCVDVNQAKTYCSAQGKRLPTEDEWEWVARSGSFGFAYPWGTEAPKAADDPEYLCWSGKVSHSDDKVWPNRPAGTCAVASFSRGALNGIFDLVGNVWEWTSNPTDTTSFVARGGSAFDDPTDLTKFRASARLVAASTSYPSVGFRCFANSK